MELSELDKKILIEISKDARQSYRELHRILGPSPITIKKHMDDLESQGIIKHYGAHIDYEKLGYEIMAFIELTISRGKMIDIEMDIAQDPSVMGVYDLTGTYDALILACFKSRDDLNDLIKKINSNDYITKTNTHLILNVIKDELSFEKLAEKDWIPEKEQE